MTIHKVGIGGKPLLEGKFSNGDRVILMIEGTVKAEPHFVQTANGGQVSEMTITAGDLLEPISKSEFNEFAERFASARAARDPEPEPLLDFE